MTTALPLESTGNAQQPWSVDQMVTAEAVTNSLAQLPTLSAALQPEAGLPTIPPVLIEPNPAIPALPELDPRAARLQALREKIAEGTYVVSAEQIARSIMDSLMWL